MKKKLATLVMSAGGLLLAAIVQPVWAHHAFLAEFDPAKPIELRGIVTKMEWINPHSWITIDVTLPDLSLIHI